MPPLHLSLNEDGKNSKFNFLSSLFLSLKFFFFFSVDEQILSDTKKVFLILWLQSMQISLLIWELALEISEKMNNSVIACLHFSFS